MTARLRYRSTAFLDWLNRVDARWGGLIKLVFGTAMLVMAVVLIIVGIQVLRQAHLARASCERSKEFGPYLAQDYKQRRVFPARIQRDYRATIPRTCD